MLDAWFFAFAGGLVVTMFATVFASVRFADTQLARSGGAVALNWAVGTLFVLASGITDAWWFNIGIDGVSALIILYRPAGRWQAILGVSYCTQLIMHAVYGWLSLRGQADPTPYYNWLTVIAWGQLLVLGGWSGGTSWRARHRGGDHSEQGISVPVVVSLEETR